MVQPQERDYCVSPIIRRPDPAENPDHFRRESPPAPPSIHVPKRSLAVSSRRPGNSFVPARATRRPMTTKTPSPRRCAGVSGSEGLVVIVFGIILLVIGFISNVSILETLGVVLAAVGVVLYLLGSAGHAVGGRRHYW